MNVLDRIPILENLPREDDFFTLFRSPI